MKEKAKLVLESGEVFNGYFFGKAAEVDAEIVFNTSMTGYQEIISDPSYCDQMICMTYPLIGNYGINRDDFESIEPSIKALVVKEACDFPSNFRSHISLGDYLLAKQITGIEGIDTRKLTRIIRQSGVLKAKICFANANVDEVVNSLKNKVYATNQVEQVSTKKPYQSPGRDKKVVLVDFGAKHGILRELNQRNCDITVVSHTITAAEIRLLKPDGIMLSNGPGDPKDVPHVLEMIREMMPEVPIFGICLGHQLIALACGADTYKLKFGHRGGNHPVLDVTTNKVSITSQNHGYAVDQASLKNTDLIETHVALNDKTNEGVKHKIYPTFSVQYHPEASPGPEDANYLFDEFITAMQVFKKTSASVVD